MASKVGKLLGTVAPIAASFIPGIGPLAGAAIGAGSSLLTGGGLKGALLGGATGGLGAGLGSQIGGSLLGEGADALGSRLIGGGLTGAAGGLLSGGGLKGALEGAGLGAAGSGASYALGQGGGLSSLFGGGSTGSSGGSYDLTKDSSGLLTGNGGISSSSPGISAATGGGGVFGGAGTGGLSSYLQPASTLLSGLNSENTNDEMKKQLLEAQGKSAAALSPFLKTGTAANSQLASNLSAGFNPGDLTQTPGFKFAQQQGEQALGRKQAASGNYFSGSALKAADQFNTGLAGQTYNGAYNQWLEKNQQLAGLSGTGQNAAGALSGVYDNQGNINANSTLAGNNIATSTLSNLLSGNGARTIVGYKADGTPIYSDTPNAAKLVGS